MAAFIEEFRAEFGLEAICRVLPIAPSTPGYTVEPVEAKGYEVIRSALTFGIAAVHGIRIDGDRLTGGADPGYDGVALLVS